ncbi:MAG: prepilin-type N-terminal cleavage/methylation domain-containing protein [Parcubacteria group bacterium]|nr:prepilin-type N-terminal cleavage/methylation domain-containing protein [Parcubacteria group bacterium]
MKSQGGFTLFETLIAMTIGVTLLGLLFSIYSLSTKSLSLGQARAELTQTSRSVIERITRDVRETQSLASPLPPDADDPGNPPVSELQMEDGHAGTLQYIRYYLDGANVGRQTVQYYFMEEPEILVPYNAEDELGNPPVVNIIEDNVVGQYVNSMLFYGQNPIYVELELEKNAVTHATRTTLYGRNL